MKGKYRLLVLDGHGSHLTPEFDEICSQNDVVPICMPAHSVHMGDLLKRGCGEVLTTVDKFDFLHAYLSARSEAFKSGTTKSSFAATSLYSFNPDRVLSKLNIFLRTPTPLRSRGSESSRNFTPKTPRTLKQLHQQASSLKKLLNQPSTSPQSPSNRVLNHLVKGFEMSIQSAIILTQENHDLRAASEKQKRKQSRSKQQIVRSEGLYADELEQLSQIDIIPQVQPEDITSTGQFQA
ncbi:hypothetical protein N7504_006271 [Penicillium tannophilum]|nr:hypothetical protein N7504_006271 [Penicillium tannophilum]